MKKLFLFSSLLACAFMISCNNGIQDKTGERLVANNWKTYVQDVAVYGEDSIYIDANVSFFSFEKKGIGSNHGTVGLIGKGDCVFWVPDVKDITGNYYVFSSNGQKAKALMVKFSTFSAHGNWTIDGDIVKIEWIPDSTIISSGSNGKSTSNDLVCKNISDALFYQANKERINNMNETLEPFFTALFQKWLDSRTELVYDENREAWTTVDGETPVMWEIKFKNE